MLASMAAALLSLQPCLTFIILFKPNDACLVPTKAMYGFKHVERANEQQAIQTLMVTDGLFRACDIPTRKKYVALVESAKENGATVQIFSSMHVSGNRLTQLSGVAAMLRFPVPEVDVGDDSSGSDSDSDDGTGYIF